MYRVAPATRLVVYGALALVLLCCIGGALAAGDYHAARYVWTAAGISVLFLAVMVRRRLAARASEYIQIDDDAITARGPAGLRTLPWASVALLKVARGGALEVVTLLVDRGADVQLQQGGRTALLAAQTGGHGPIVEYLRAHGAR